MAYRPDIVRWCRCYTAVVILSDCLFSNFDCHGAVECEALVTEVNTVAVVGGGVELSIAYTIFNELVLNGVDTVFAETLVVKGSCNQGSPCYNLLSHQRLPSDLS